ncbi:MAG: hypothetical protein HQM03_07745 [Magnetococcales bacterium]|nr:hypothetical protein [Magnetococcales bacterium]
MEPHHGGGGKHGNKYDDYPAGATADDRAWIRECIRDNRHEGQSKRTVTIYCTCMNNRMSDNETRSITQWEKSHPRAMAACEAEAGWR